MITVSELRIGNWFKNDEGVFLSVHGLGPQENRIIWYDKELGFYLDENEAFPIPITPEILYKAGFRDCSCGGWQDENFHLRPGFIYSNGNIEVKTVHQLQNLYFVLTGKDLEIKL